MRAPFLLLILSLLLAAAAAGQANLRAYHADGQTFLVWDDTLGLGPEDVTTYSVYRSATPFLDVADATLVGKVFAADWLAGRLAKSAGAGATFTVPDGLGGALALDSDDALFVYTPHAAGAEFFAVIQTGETQTSAATSVGPVVQALDPVQPHWQHSGIDAGHPYDVYAVWVDGRADVEDARPGFPVMGNASFNGTPQVFAVFEPTSGLPAAPMPAVVAMHGGGGSYWSYRPGKSEESQLDMHVEDGLYVSLDDQHNLYGDVDPANPTILSLPLFWFGCREGYDRFSSGMGVPPDDAVVVDYVMRRTDWILDWLVAERGVDADRISMLGVSNGARGANCYARSRPERIAAALCFVHPLAPTQAQMPALIGELEQDLPTNLPGDIGIVEFLFPTTLVVDADLPLRIFVWGTGDDVVPWAADAASGYGGIPPVILELDDQRSGAHVFWDERGHVGGNGGWDGAAFTGAPKLSAQSLTRHRANRSYPAIFGVDHDVTAPGAAPDPGDAIVPANGNPFGARGGWCEWLPAAIVDEPDLWAVTLRIEDASTGFGPPSAEATASVLVRRPQQFAPRPFDRFLWTQRDVATGATVQSGMGWADGEGRVAVQDLLLDATPDRVEIRLVDPVLRASLRADGVSTQGGASGPAPAPGP